MAEDSMDRHAEAAERSWRERIPNTPPQTHGGKRAVEAVENILIAQTAATAEKLFVRLAGAALARGEPVAAIDRIGLAATCIQTAELFAQAVAGWLETMHEAAEPEPAVQGDAPCGEH